MNYRKMGDTGLNLSEIAFGAFVTFGDEIDETTASALLHRAYERGVNFFDNADSYAGGHAETVMGQAIRDLSRETLVLSSKVYWPTMPGENGRGLSRKHIMESCHASLKRLQTDYVDLYFCHRYDPDVPLEEVVRAMSDLVQQGKVLYWGTSNWRASQIAAARAIGIRNGSYLPCVEQPEYNMLVRRMVEDELRVLASESGLGIIVWSPLRNGLLTGKYNKEIPAGSRLSLDRYFWLREVRNEASLEKVRRLGELAAELGITLPQLAIGWILRLPQVSCVITGATKMEQLDENLSAGEVLSRLTPEMLKQIDDLLENAPQPEG